MLYDLGRIDDYVYIYNTSDNSCRLLHKDCIDECEEVNDRGSLSPAKLKMLYPNFSDNSAGIVYNLFQYDVKFCGYGIVTFVACVGLIDMHSKSVKHLILSKHYERFKYGDYLLCLMIKQISGIVYTSQFTSTPCLWDFVISKSKYGCLPFPLQMLENILDSRNFKYIDSVFHGVLFENLKVCTYNKKWLTLKHDLVNLDIRWY